jgi:triosephosphate isomerase
MNAANAAQLLAQPDIDGGLIGGASLKAPDFLTIIAAAQAEACQRLNRSFE